MKNNQLTLPPHQKCWRKKNKRSSKLPQYCKKGLSSCLHGYLPRETKFYATTPPLYFFANGPAVPLARQPPWSAKNLVWELLFAKCKLEPNRANTEATRAPRIRSQRQKKLKFTRPLLERGILPNPSRRKDPVLNHTEVLQRHSRASSFVLHTHHHDHQTSSSCGKNAFTWHLLLELLYW